MPRSQTSASAEQETWFSGSIGGSSIRPVLTPVPLLCMRLYRRHTHNGLLRESRGDWHSPCHVLEDSRFLAMSHTCPRLDIQVLEKLSLAHIHLTSQWPVCTQFSTQRADSRRNTRGPSPKDRDNLTSRFITSIRLRTTLQARSL